MHHGHRASDLGRHQGQRSTASSTTSRASRPSKIVDLGIALVPEGRRLFPRLTVEENLLLGAYRRSGARGDGEEPGVLLRDLSGSRPTAAGSSPAA